VPVMASLCHYCSTARHQPLSTKQRQHCRWHKVREAALARSVASLYQISFRQYAHPRNRTCRLELQGTGFVDAIQIYVGPFTCDVDLASITPISVSIGPAVVIRLHSSTAYCQLTHRKSPWNMFKTTNRACSCTQVHCFTRAAPDYASYSLTVIIPSTGDSFTTCCFSFHREMSPSKCNLP
jgi:hypothetical protein